MFSDRIEAQVPPAKGASHVHARGARDPDLPARPAAAPISAAALDLVARLALRRSVIFLISDFELPDDAGATLANLERAARPVARATTSSPSRCAIRASATLPDLGLVTVEDAETGDVVTLDTGRRRRARALRGAGRQARRRDAARLARLGIETLPLDTDARLPARAARFFDARKEARDEPSDTCSRQPWSWSALPFLSGSGTARAALSPSVPAPVSSAPVVSASARDTASRGHPRHPRPDRDLRRDAQPGGTSAGGGGRRWAHRYPGAGPPSAIPVLAPHERALRALDGSAGWSPETRASSPSRSRRSSGTTSRRLSACRAAAPDDRGAPGRPDAGSRARSAAHRASLGEFLRYLRPREVRGAGRSRPLTWRHAGQRRGLRSRDRARRSPPVVRHGRARAAKESHDHVRSPSSLWLLLALPAVALLRSRRGPRAAVRYASVATARAVARTSRARLGSSCPTCACPRLPC